MFEYEYGRRPREWVVMLLLGVVGLFAAYSPQLVAALWGVRAGLLFPGLVLLVVSGVQFSRATRLRDRYFSAEGTVVSVERHSSRNPTITGAGEIPPEFGPIGGSAARQRAMHGERSESYRGSVTLRFPLASGELRFVEVSGLLSYQVGDSVLMLYQPQAPEEALPQEMVRLQLYSEAAGYGLQSILFLGSALFFFWLFT